MKILYIGRYNPEEDLTGPEKVAKRIFFLSSKENETAFLEYFFDGSVYGMFKKLFGKEVIETDPGVKVYRLGLIRMLPFFFKFHPQIIHIITFERFSAIALLYNFFSKVKMVYNVHGIAVYENEYLKNVPSSLKFKDCFCEKLFMKHSDKLLFLSEYQLRIAKKYYYIDSRKIEFINNGVDEEFYSTNKPNYRNEIPSLIFIGDSERKDKDFHFLYSTLDKVRKKCNLYVIGNFNKEIYKTKVGNVNIVPVERMPKEALVKFLSGKDIFISSSFYDTFSVAAAECMTMGLAPIVTDHTGISKLLITNENGFVIKYGNNDELAEKINFLLENANLRNDMREKAKQIYDTLNWSKVYSSYQNIYNTLG